MIFQKKSKLKRKLEIILRFEIECLISTKGDKKIHLSFGKIKYFKK